jgi:glycosyltransferase involved in cell wall biosynthesis
MNLYISPPPTEYQEDGRGSGGIWRIINAMARWLPTYGVNVVEDPGQADIAHIHAGALIDTGLPIVQSCHGYYWTGDFKWPRNYWEYNAAVIEVSRRASRILVPSEWVAYPIRRDMRKVPDIIPHGIDLEDFEVQKEHAGYVLWAKPRVDEVCNPKAVNVLAEKVSDIQFWTTFGRPTSNVKVFGALPYDDFQTVMAGAMLWLATARETGDIGSREAMARGIPVLGWDWGATGELIKHQETGYLAQPGNYDDLLSGLYYCLENRKRLSENAREDIKQYQWKDMIGRYVKVYQEVLNDSRHEVDVSVIVPTYNYAHFLPEALQSIIGQTFQGKLEVVLVDDCSEDEPNRVLDEFYRQYPDFHWQCLSHEQNRGLPAAMNTGLEAATGEYVTFLDADNLLTPDAIQILYSALEAKPWLDVVSGNLAMYAQDGNHHAATDWPFGKVDPLAQLNHINQLPSTSLMRIESIKHLGGYRQRQRKNEDGEFWCRAMSAGLRFEQVTDEPVLIYRWHDDNKSKVEGGEDDPEGPLSWNYHYPWKENYGIMPFASTVPAPRGSWAVRSYDRPHIAVVIPCGPGHQKYLVDALDSIIGQSFQNFECVIANDTGEELDVVSMGHPWVRVVNTPGRVGPAIARNTAIAAAKAPLILPLDADDMLYPNTLLRFYQAWLEFPNSLVYMNCDYEDSPSGRREDYSSGNWSYDAIRSDAIYQDVILFAKQWWDAVGGYPTDQPYGMWEDWLFGVKLHIAGIGATYIREPWGLYRRWAAGEGGKSKNDIDNVGYGSPEFKAKLHEVYDWIQRKEIDMPCRGCGSRGSRTVTKTKSLPRGQVREGELVVVYEGDRAGGWHVNSRAIPGRKYRIRPKVPFTVNGGDAYIATLPGFREITPAEHSAAPELPTKPPEVPEIKLDKPQSPPVTSFAEAIKSIEVDSVRATPKDNGQKSMEEEFKVFSHLKRVSLRDLERAGFVTLEKVKQDISTGGFGLLQIRGLGPSTLALMKRALEKQERVHA